jgi:Zn-dependent peptidase ImmA (M78 family)/DNA-binding XRE family transcriptional regulator
MGGAKSMGTKAKSSFGSFAKSARLDGGYGLREAAREMGVSGAYLSSVENGSENPSGKLMESMARLYGVPLEDLTSRATKPRATAAAHGRAMQLSPELRALYRLGTELDADGLEELIRKFLQEKGITDDKEIEKKLLQLKSELPRINKNARDGLFAAEARPRFLSKRKIADMAYERLRRNGLTEESYKPPTPIETLVDNEDGLLYRIEELRSDKRGNPMVLGLTGWDEGGNRQIVINSCLADSDRASDVHRFNFTLGHELFHAVEHLPRMPKERVGSLNRVHLGGAIFVENEQRKFRSPAERAVNAWATKSGGPRVLATDEDWREWQANVFSSALLMPEWAVREEFEARVGTQSIVLDHNRNPRDAALDLADKRVFDSTVYDRSLADLFGVSRQAMAIRLLELGLVGEEVED